MSVGPVVANNLNFNMAAAAILDFEGYQFSWYNLIWTHIFGLCVKFGAIWFKNGQVMAV